MSKSILSFRKGVFIAVRHDTGWWLAQLYTHVFKGTEKARIRWFDLEDKKNIVFKVHECNDIPAQSIICEVKVKRVSRSPLKVSIDKEQYALIGKYFEACKNPGSFDFDDDDVDEGQVVCKKVSPRKTVQRSSKVKAKATSAKSKSTIKSKIKKVMKKAAPVVGSKRKATTTKAPAKKTKLSVYAGSPVYETNPVFDPKVVVPPVASTVDFWLFIRALRNKDFKAMEKMVIEKKLHSIGLSYKFVDSDVNFLNNGWEHAILRKDKALFKKLVDLGIKNKKYGCDLTDNLSNVIRTGEYNIRSLGIEHVRPITVGRGSREGDNAFTPIVEGYIPDFPETETLVEFAARNNCDLAFVRGMVKEKLRGCSRNNTGWEPMGAFETAVRWGNHKLASEIAEKTFNGGAGDKDQFNLLHVQVLNFDGIKALSAFKPVACHKKTGYEYGRITPLHSVCINPKGVKYLKQMLAADPLSDIKDNADNYLIHFAAMSATSDCTKYLITIDVDLNVINNQKMTPLMMAARVGSVANIKALMGYFYSEAYRTLTELELNPKLKIDMSLVREVVADARGGKKLPDKNPGAKDASTDDNTVNTNDIYTATIKKFGVGDINKPAIRGPTFGYTPLILAVEYGHLDAVEVLLKLGADPNKALTADRRKKTPLMIAIINGRLDIARTLVLYGAKVNTKDRHGLIAFHYAAKTNQLHCLSWLAATYLKDVNVGDSSGNTALQYAAAEGYILVVKYLVEELRCDVALCNNWGTSALANAVLRQQTGVIEYLLDQPNIDLNFRDNQGATMIMRLAAANLSSSMELIQWLVNKGGDVKLKDNQGLTALHYFCTQRNSNDKDEQAMFEKMLVMLIDRGGLDPNEACKNDKKPMDIALGVKNLHVMKGLIKRGAKIAHQRFGDYNVVQHFITLLARDHDYGKEMLQVIRKNISKEEFLAMIEEQIPDGINGVHIAFKLLSETPNPSMDDHSLRADEQRKVRNFVWRLLYELLSLPGASYDVNIPAGKRKIKETVQCDKNHENFPETDDVKHPRCCSLYPYGREHIKRPFDYILQYCRADEIRKFVEKFHPGLNYEDDLGLTPLHRAVKDNDTQKIRQLVSLGASVNQRPGRGFTKTPTEHWKQPILLMGAKTSLNLVPLLTDLGADVLAKDRRGTDTLHFIVKRSSEFTLRISIVEDLLSKIKDINTVDGSGCTYLHNAIIGMEGGTDVSIEILSMLLSKGADPNIKNCKGMPPLHYAFLDGSSSYNFKGRDPIEVVSSLTHRMKPELITAPDSHEGFTALHLAAMTGGYVTCMHLISKGCEVDKVDNQGNTPLSLAVVGKHQSVVLLLIQNSANIDRSVKYPIFRREPEKETMNSTEAEENDRYVWLPTLDKPFTNSPPNRFYKNSNVLLYKVIDYEWQGVVFALIDRLKKPFIPIEAALLQCKFNLAITLMLKYGDTLNKEDSNEFGQSLLHILCLVPRNDLQLQERVLNLLVKFGFAKDKPDAKFNGLPLHYACLQRKANLMDILINPHNINVEDSFGRTPLCAYLWNERAIDYELVRKLVKEKGADLNILCDFNIFESGFPTFGSPKLSGRNDYFSSYSSSYTILGKFVIEEQRKSLKEFLLLGANPNLQDSSGRSALMYAAKLNDLPAVKTILSESSLRVDVGLQCNEGKTVLHYAVQATPSAQFQCPNVIMYLLKQSNSCGLPKDYLIYKVKDKRGKTPFDYCIENGFDIYLKVFNTHCKSSAKNALNGPVIVNMDTTTSNNVDFEGDSKAFLDAWLKDNVPEDRSNLALPDSCLSLSKEECEVCTDEDGTYFDVLMTKIDLKSQYWELYNFYKMQIVKNMGKNIYILLTKWGRIGDDGQHQETPFPSLEECKREFEKVFKSKTKNDWADFVNFVPQKGKYKPITRERRYKNIYKEIKYNFKVEEDASGLDKSIKKLMEDGARPKEVSYLLSDRIKLQVTNTPFGFIPGSELDKASAILVELENTLNKFSSTDGGCSFENDNDEYVRLKNKIWDLSADLYHLIPQLGYSSTKISPLNSNNIKSWKENIRNLKELEIVNKILAGSQHKAASMHPLKYIYQSLDCIIERVPPHSDVAQYLLRNFKISGANRNVSGIFQVTRAPEASIHAAPGEQRLLLFHGIKTGALLSILKRGLQNAPYGISHGNAFGDGIYLADRITKAMDYSRATCSESCSYVLAVSISMEKLWRHAYTSYYRSYSKEEYPEDAKTVWIVGKQFQDFSKTVVLPNGCILGLGEWQHREYDEGAEAKYQAEEKRKAAEAKKKQDERKKFKFAAKQKPNKSSLFVFDPPENSDEEDEDYVPEDDDSESRGSEDDEDYEEDNSNLAKAKRSNTQNYELYSKVHLYDQVFTFEPFNKYTKNEVRNMIDRSEFVVKDPSMLKLEYLIQFKH